MAEHLSDQTLERYRRRRLAPADLLAANDHLAACDACYERFSREQGLEAAYAFVRADLQEAAEPDHPVYEQMAAYVDQQMSQREAERLQSHIEGCRPCGREVSDLRALKAVLSSSEETIANPPPTLRERRFAFWRLPVYRPAFQAAAVVVVALLSVWLATIPLRTRVADLEAQLAEVRQGNEQLRREQQTAELAIAELKADLAQAQAAYVAPAPGSSQPIVLALNDGGRQITVDQQGNLEGLNSLTPAHLQMLKTALAAERVAASPMIARLRGKARELMGGSSAGASFILLGPVGTVVQSDRPVLRWTALSGATGYVVTVYKPGSRAAASEVATSPMLSATEWRVPQPLKPGDTYAWQVRALKGGEEIRMPAPSAPDAKFKVLEPSKVEELERAKQTYAGSHLMLGLLYAQAGLLDSAEQEFRALVEANPRVRAAQNLLGSVQAMRRR